VKRVIACLSLLLLLTACQPTLKAEVTRFYGLPPITSGQSFSVLPDKSQEGSLEFQHYAALLSGG